MGSVTVSRLSFFFQSTVESGIIPAMYSCWKSTLLLLCISGKAVGQLSSVSASAGNLLTAQGERPRIEAASHGGLVLDGELADWKEIPFTSVTPATGVFDAETARTESPEDLSFRFAVCHDREALYVAVEVTDDVIRTNGCAAGAVSCAAWDADAVEVFIDGNHNRAPDSRLLDGSELKYGGEFALVANGAANSDYSGYPKTFGRADTWQGATHWREAQAGAKKVCYEFRITWAMMGGRVKPGDTLGFTLSVQDNDSGHRNHALYWSGNPVRPYADECGFGDLVLVPYP
jgi:hypothetical protein